MSDFFTGFTVTGRLLLCIAGGAAAVLLMILVTLLFLVIAAVIFDQVTTGLARRWTRKGRKPKNRLERVILASHARERGTPG